MKNNLLTEHLIISAVILAGLGVAGCTTATTRPDDLLRRTLAIVPPTLPLNSPEFERAMDGRTHSRLLPGNTVTFYQNGSEAYPAMLAAIRSARNRVEFSVYSYADGLVGREFLREFTAAAARGVRVRLTYDRFGSPDIRREFFAPLAAAGGEIRTFNPYKAWTWLRLNNRNHQKILTVDGTTAFMGSVNIADKHNGDGFNSWRDTVWRVTGPVVAATDRLFTRTWHEAGANFFRQSLPFIGTFILKDTVELPLRLLLDRKEEKFTARATNIPAPAPLTDSFTGVPLRLVAHSPENLSCNLINMMELAIQAAEKRICLCTPYFIPPPRLRKALVCARARGVEVTILTQGPSDVDFMPLASQRYINYMLKRGVKIYAWPHSILHAKYMVIDGKWATLGSTNFDSRSFVLNYEANYTASDERLAAALEAVFLRDTARAVVYNEYRRTDRKVPWLLWALRHHF